MASSPQQDDFQTKLRSLLSQQTSGKQFDARNILNDTQLAATMSKLIHARDKTTTNVTQTGNQGDSGNMFTGIDQISRTTASRVEDNENVFMLFPDIELAVQIVISSMLSPKDMVQTDLIYRLENNRFPATLSTKLMEIVREEIEKNYKLKERVYDIFRDALFRTGSHPIGVFPEAAVDYIVNAPGFSMESAVYETKLFAKVAGERDKPINIGILGDPHAAKSEQIISFENFASGKLQPNYNAKLWADEANAIKTWESNPDLADIFTDPKKAIEAIAGVAKATLEVVDNSDILRLPAMLSRATETRVKEVFSKERKKLLKVAVENFALDLKPKDKVSPELLQSTLYKGYDTRHFPYMALPGKHNLHRRSVGRPLEINFPSESLIPIHTPGNFRKHVGYFCVLDAEGTPLTFNQLQNDYGQGINGVMQSDRNNQSMSSLLTERARKNLISDNFTPHINKMADVYADIVEHDLIERLSRGIYRGKDLKISKDNDIFRVMMYRSLKGHFTRILFIPAEYVTYFAFDYHQNGVGRSYLDQLSSITSLRAMVLYSKVWAQVRSSIETTDVKITFDPRDPDPLKTINTVENLVARSRQSIFPNGLRRVADFTDWLQRAGLRFTFDGHPRLPNTKLDFESTKIDHAEPNNELEEDLRHMTYMHFGLSPETVDSAAKADFATTVENNSILFSKRINMLNDAGSKDLTDYVSKVMTHDAVIQQRIVEAFVENKADIEEMLTNEERELYENGDRVEFTEYLIQTFISSIVVDLPRAASTSNENMKREIEGYETLIDKVLSYVIDKEMLPAEYIGDASEYIDSLKSAWKAELMRRFFADNNIAPEVFEIATLDEDGKPMVNMLSLIETHSNNVQLAAVDLLKRFKERRELVAKDIEAINPGEATPGTDTPSGEENNDNPFGDDMGLDTPEPEELTTEEPEPEETPNPEDNTEEKKPE